MIHPSDIDFVKFAYFVLICGVIAVAVLVRFFLDRNDGYGSRPKSGQDAGKDESDSEPS